jgi:hypothetical protein
VRNKATYVIYNALRGKGYSEFLHFSFFFENFLLLSRFN